MAQVNQFRGSGYANPSGLANLQNFGTNKVSNPAGVASIGKQPNVGNFGFPSMQQAPQKGFFQGFKNFLAGTPESFQQVPTQTLQGMQALQQLLSGGMEGLEDIYSGFEPLEQQAREQFYTETIPSLAERFTAFGGGGGQRSSAFQGALGQAGSGLERQLAALKSQYGLQNRQGLLQQLQLGLTPQFDTVHTARQPGIFERLPEIAAKAAAAYAGGA